MKPQSIVYLLARLFGLSSDISQKSNHPPVLVQFASCFSLESAQREAAAFTSLSQLITNIVPNENVAIMLDGGQYYVRPETIIPGHHNMSNIYSICEMLLPFISLPHISSFHPDFEYPVRITFSDSGSFVFTHGDERLTYRQYYDLEMRFKELRDIHENTKMSLHDFKLFQSGLVGELGGLDRMIMIERLVKILTIQVEYSYDLMVSWRALFQQHHPLI
jgi:hypothetical protein